MNVELIAGDMVPLSPGEIRALGWVTARHPGCVVRITHATEDSGVGWIIARIRTAMTVSDYFLSPTGRVFLGEPSWPDHFHTERTDRVLRDADYAAP